MSQIWVSCNTVNDLGTTERSAAVGFSFGNGKYIGSFSSEEAVREAKKYEKCVIDYKGYPRGHVGKRGWSSIASE
jgi:hypothetical protein